ncbi:MAG: SagB/ThcOx family dehydrogenase [Candidatus Pacebacteria bacterium]|nr:SagB/ThcOx family dehydrogenase [Candidatus Paceibacterota bacterium]
MEKFLKTILIFFVLCLMLFGAYLAKDFFKTHQETGEINVIEPPNIKKEIYLPQPRYESEVSLEEAILRRRSRRKYKKEPLSLFEVSQLLWSAQGITDKKRNFRTAPSAGALYPLEVYLVVGAVENLLPGVYKYYPKEHKIVRVKEEDLRKELREASFGQKWVEDGAVSLVFAGVFERTTKKYGKKGVLYVYMEAGHASQNVYLQAEALGLGTVTVGGFLEERVKEILSLPENETPLYIMPVGKL